ncbi:MAG TPA: endo-1,3-alpha-glucanase family glycosylhydrolase, partial [Candidatus Acidoferrum sp.]|nr:endo-1,3-alpha-glucanase family glycosylhydrolase [Candidatus Acidoferrum sp.]
MVAEPTYGASVQGFEHDIQDAQAAGIDGFALDLGAYDDPKQGYYNANVAFMYSAAEALGTGFKLFFSVEFTNTASIVNLLSTYAGRTNTFRVGTNMVVSTYTADNVDWQNGVFAPLSQSGISVCFVPYFWPVIETLPPYPTTLNILTTYSSLLNGFFYFGAGSLPTNLAVANSSCTAAAHQAGKISMASASPTYWGDGQYYNGRRYFEFDGGEGTITQWQSIIASQPDWVEITTWNDYNESTYISPVYNLDQTQTQFVTPHRYCHAGYLELAKRYIAWYKTGVPPVTNQDALYYFYRIHSLKLVAPKDIAVTNLQGDIADVVYNTLFLTAPAQLQVVSGTKTVSYSLGAGLQQVRTPFAPGSQTFTLTRKGTPVLSVQGTPILSAITNYDY